MARKKKKEEMDIVFNKDESSSSSKKKAKKSKPSNQKDLNDNPESLDKGILQTLHEKHYLKLSKTPGAFNEFVQEYFECTSKAAYLATEFLFEAAKNNE